MGADREMCLHSWAPAPAPPGLGAAPRVWRGQHGQGRPEQWESIQTQALLERGEYHRLEDS